MAAAEASALPVAVLLIKAVGWVQATIFLLLANRRAGRLHSAHATASTTGSPAALLAYRLAGFAWALFIGINQLADKGRYVFTFFTVWNWWLLTAFFGLASAASLRAVLRTRRKQRSSSSSRGAGRAAAGSGSRARQQPGKQPELELEPADWLDRAVMALFTIEMPASLVLDALTWLVLVPMVEAAEQDPARRNYWRSVHHHWESYNMALSIDFLTWALLVPMLLSDPSPARVAFWRSKMFCFESYNQHGFNAFMMLGDLALNQIPAHVYDSGWLALWGSLYGVWSGLFYSRTGRFIYPFLDAHKPYSWASYLGIFGVMWAAYALFLGMVRLRTRLTPPGRAVPLAKSSSSAAAGRPSAVTQHGSSIQHAAAIGLVESPLPMLSDKVKVG